MVIVKDKDVYHRKKGEEEKNDGEQSQMSAYCWHQFLFSHLFKKNS